MKGRTFRLGMWFLVTLGFGAAVSIVLFLSPYNNTDSLQENIVNIGAFYVSLSLFFTGFFSLILYWIRRKAMADEDVQHINIGVSFRQGFLLSGALIFIIILQSFRILIWWDGLLAIGAMMMIELYFLAR